jgi:hypothetical protein
MWSNDARCLLLDKTYGHISGTVMRRSKLEGRKKATATQCYDVAWKFSGLGESSIASGYLLDASHISKKCIH